MDWLEYFGSIGEQVLLIIAPIIATMIAAWLGGLIKQAWALAQQTVGRNWQWALDEGAVLVVRAAEQLWEDNQDKKAYAVATLQTFLDERGIKIDVALIEAAVEAAVQKEFNQEPAG